MGLSNNLGKLSNMITSTGSAVGIAQASPAYTLDISGTLRNTTSAYFATTSGVAVIGATSANAISKLSVRIDATHAIAFEAISPAGNKSIYIAPVDSGTHLISSNYLIGSPYLPLAISARENTSDLYLAINGNIGIGTSSPASYSLLDVNGQTVFRGNPILTSGNAFKFNNYYNSGTGTDRAVATGYAGQIYFDTSAGYISFQNSSSSSSADANVTNTERMRITSGGNVLINNTSSVGSKLIVKADGTSNAGYAAIFWDSTSNDLFYLRNDGLVATGTRTFSPYNYAASGRAMIVDASGFLGYLVSTRESKANIKSIENVDFINQLNPVSFNYRKKDNKTNEFTDEVYKNTTYGFIADEVEKINKELVFYNEDGTLAGVEYNNMIAILTKAVQELKAEIDILKNK